MDTEESRENPQGAHRPETMRPQKRSIACHRCHTQKIKCSGERPCSRCRKAGCASQCRYTSRDRKIRVDESYLEQLIHDSQELHAARNKASPKKQPEVSNLIPSQLAQPPNLSENEPWFQTDGPSTLYINEAACVAFATRVCQYLKPEDSRLPLGIPQRNYTDESTLASLAQVDKHWPTLVCAQLLVKTALGHINPGFHIVLNKEVMDGILHIYQSGRFDHPITKCRYFALFAIGQVFSTPPNSLPIIPGTDYFAHALRLIHIIPERPSMAHIESLLLLAYYCQFLNRFHSAYLLIGNALRLSLSLGLNYNVPRSQSLTQVEREHRVRIWWSIYILDRFWGSKSGFPVQIHDDDIYVDLPSSQSETLEGYEEYFFEGHYQTAAIELARITGRITRDIYTRRKSTDSLLQRQHTILVQLRHWVNNLPESLKLHADRPGSSSKHTVHIHLQFSYSVMLAIRPVLLYSLDRGNSQIEMQDEDSKLMLTTLSTACIHAARYSLKLCLDEWTTGSLATHGYAYPAFLFSSALVLIISSVSPVGNRCDQAASETATEMLKILSASDNLAAKDLYEQLMKVRQCLDTSGGNGISSEPRGSLVAQQVDYDTPAFEASTLAHDLDHFFPPYFEPARARESEFATENILQTSLMQDFLSKSTSDVGLLTLPEMPNDFDTAFLCFDTSAGL